MNVLKMADGLSGLLPQKTKLHLLRFQTGELIGKFKVSSELLPESFHRPTQIDINGALWRVMRAEIVREGSYVWKRLIRLYVQEPENSQSVATHNVPTYAFPIPLFSDTALFDQFTLDLLPEEWRQIEFVPIQKLSIVQEMILGIEAVLDAEDKGTYLKGYDSAFIRESLGQNNLQISLEDFCTVVSGIQSKGKVMMRGELVQNAFALRANDHIYYGIIEGDLIRDLAILKLDYMDDEINTVLEQFGLMLASWCDTRIFLVGKDEEGPQDQSLMEPGSII